MCDPAFLHLVCTECEVVHLTWPKTATSPEQDEVGTVEGSHLPSGNLTVCY